MHRITIDCDECNSCKTCVDACFLDVLRWDEEEETPIVAYPADCVGCNVCELACREQCIEVVPTLPGPFPEPY
jgi:NAD-dependent dihydropyrimidine dehydrogenase PreA subunit